jgi:hypothetical protein
VAVFTTIHSKDRDHKSAIDSLLLLRKAKKMSAVGFVGDTWTHSITVVPYFMLPKVQIMERWNIIFY